MPGADLDILEGTNQKYDAEILKWGRLKIKKTFSKEGGTGPTGPSPKSASVMHYSKCTTLAYHNSNIFLHFFQMQ